MAVLNYVGWNGYAKKGKTITYCKDSFGITEAYKRAIQFIEEFEKEYLDTKYYEYAHMDISGTLIIQWICDKGSDNCYPVYIEIC